MLGDKKIIGLIPITDAARATAFYSDKLGLKFVSEDPFALVFDANGIMLRLTKMKEFTPQGLRHIASGMRSQVEVDESARVWGAVLAVPFAAIVGRFDPAQPWRVNFFRCEGLDPQRYYSSWQPTETEQPNFHVPQKFGWLRFAT